MNDSFVAAAGIAAAASSLAQVVVYPQSLKQNVRVVTTQPPINVLRAGAPVSVALMEPLTRKGKALKAGQIVRLEVAKDVLLNGRVAIPARSPVEGVLTEVRNKRMFGKSGVIHLHINSVNINGTPVRLRGDVGTRWKTSPKVPLNLPGRAILDQDITVAAAS